MQCPRSADHRQHQQRPHAVTIKDVIGAEVGGDALEQIGGHRPQIGQQRLGQPFPMAGQAERAEAAAGRMIAWREQRGIAISPVSGERKHKDVPGGV